LKIMTDDEMKALRVTTEALQGHEDIEAFREIFGREILGIEIDPLDGHPLDINLTLRSLPGVATASGTLSPMRNRHSSAKSANTAGLRQSAKAKRFSPPTAPKLPSSA
jgi:hypothetical protein